LKLGGKSPVVVLDDADVDAVIPGAASAIFFNHGQCCCAGSRLMVHKKIFDKVVAGVADEAKRSSSDPASTQVRRWDRSFPTSSSSASPATSIPVSRKAQRSLPGGKKGSEDGGYFVQPTLITKTNPEMKVVREEIFGPVVCASPITDADLEAIASQANSTTYGLAASV